MKMKKRFKESLFAFFKDEIMKAAGWDDVGVDHVQFVCKEVKMTQIKSEIRLGVESRESYGAPPGVIYQEALEQCKRRLFDKTIKYIQIDERSIMDHTSYNERAIRVSLMIGEPQK